VANTDVRVVRAYDSMYGNGKHAFSIVADSDSVQFVFPIDKQLFDGKSRISRLTSDKSKAKPKNANDWIKLAIKGLGSFEYSVVAYPEDVDTVKKAVTEEKNEINSEENNSISPRKVLATVEQQNISSAVSIMMSENEEFSRFVEGDLDELSDEDAKQHITDLIIASGTLDENPWLEPWLNGEDMESLDFSRGLVLTKPAKKFENFQSNFDSALFEEEEEEETD